MTIEGAIPIEEAARRLGTTVLATLMHIKRKRLDGEERDGAWFVSAGSIERFRSEGGGSPEVHSCRGMCGGCSGKG